VFALCPQSSDAPDLCYFFVSATKVGLAFASDLCFFFVSATKVGLAFASARVFVLAFLPWHVMNY